MTGLGYVLILPHRSKDGTWRVLTLDWSRGLRLQFEIDLRKFTFAIGITYSTALIEVGPFIVAFGRIPPSA